MYQWSSIAAAGRVKRKEEKELSSLDHRKLNKRTTIMPSYKICYETGKKIAFFTLHMIDYGSLA